MDLINMKFALLENSPALTDGRPEMKSVFKWTLDPNAIYYHLWRTLIERLVTSYGALGLVQSISGFHSIPRAHSGNHLVLV